ncbi:hypothetical protein D3C74_298410 [compost metagenome]
MTAAPKSRLTTACASHQVHPTCLRCARPWTATRTASATRKIPKTQRSVSNASSGWIMSSSPSTTRSSPRTTGSHQTFLNALSGSGISTVSRPLRLLRTMRHHRSSCAVHPAPRPGRQPSARLPGWERYLRSSCWRLVTLARRSTSDNGSKRANHPAESGVIPRLSGPPALDSQACLRVLTTRPVLRRRPSHAPRSTRSGRSRRPSTGHRTPARSVRSSRHRAPSATGRTPRSRSSTPPRRACATRATSSGSCCAPWASRSSCSCPCTRTAPPRASPRTSKGSPTSSRGSSSSRSRSSRAS